MDPWDKPYLDNFDSDTTSQLGTREGQTADQPAQYALAKAAELVQVFSEESWT
jgi:hypothetical protein